MNLKEPSTQLRREIFGFELLSVILKALKLETMEINTLSHLRLLIILELP